MKYDPHKHQRKSIRLEGYDYSSAGAYFVTIVTQERVCIFGEVTHRVMRLNAAGQVVYDWWNKLDRKFPAIVTDTLAIMPNHMHGIIVIVGAHPRVRPDKMAAKIAGQTHGSAPTSLSHVVQWFKTMTTNAYIQGVRQHKGPEFSRRLWQRNFYERIIRNERECNAIRDYIVNNPENWADDPENIIHATMRD